MSSKGILKAKNIIFLFKKALDRLEREDWSNFTIERFQPRLNCETKRGNDQKMKWISKCIEKGQISRANNEYKSPRWTLCSAVVQSRLGSLTEGVFGLRNF